MSLFSPQQCLPCIVLLLPPPPPLLLLLHPSGQQQ
jgi:hypothetical protein